jgi:hypothetical protein
MSPSPFSDRVRPSGHSRVAEHWPMEDQNQPQVFAVNDELLVSKDIDGKAARKRVRAWLNSHDARLLSTVFALLPEDGTSDDVEIWQLPPSLQDAGNHDVFWATDQLRQFLPEQHDKVGPNHILIPANNGDNCPYGAPSQAGLPGGPDLPTWDPSEGAATTPITVIDAGWYWDDQWGENPLNAHCRVSLYKTQWLNHANVGQPSRGWEDDPDETLDAANKLAPLRLDAIAGHANFVAGVIAQNCPQPDIAIWSHNGSFAFNLESIPLESSVCRSIRRSQLPEGSPSGVINLGFAFASYGNTSHDLWNKTLQLIGGRDTRIVAPAGNQGTDDPRYPAALHDDHPYVFGVASLDGQQNGSTFSNRGGWVTCSTLGEDVVSTFLRVDLPPEEEPTNPHAFDSYAVWNGTCFAAPKLTAAFARGLSLGNLNPGPADPNWGLKF